MDMKSPVTQGIRSYLLEAMRTGEYAGCLNLPPENVLAGHLGISRTQLRDVLASLEQEGFITRRHGVGTVINRRVLRVPVRMDEEVEFLEMIRRSGFEAAVSDVHVQVGPADNFIAGQLQMEAGAPVVRVDRICTADGRPVIYCEDYVAKGLVKDSYPDEDFKLPIFCFLRRACRTEPYLDITEIHPAAADEKLAALLGLPPGAPLLYMEELDYDIEGKPVLYAKEYFVDGVLHHIVLRKNL